MKQQQGGRDEIQTLDLFQASRLVVDGNRARWLAAALFLVFIGLWFVLPRAQAVQRIVLGQRS